MAGTFGKWNIVLKTLANGPKDLKQARRMAVLQEAQFLRGHIVKGLGDQTPGGKQFKPLSPLTLAVRRFAGFKGTKALLRRGDLRNAIAVIEVGDTIFVGVPRTARGSNGQSLVDVAAINEYGGKPVVIKITPRMMAFLMAAFRKEGIDNDRYHHVYAHTAPKQIIIVQIPARPFIRPILEKYGQPKDIEKRLAERVEKLMRGKGPWTAANKVL